MQYFIDSVAGNPYEFDDNVTATKGADDLYTFTYTTGDRLPDIVTPATYAPDTIDEDGNAVPGAKLTPEVVTPGALIAYPISAPATLQPCTQTAFIAAQQPKPMTAAEILSANTATQNSLLSSASVALAPLQTAVTLGIATDAETASAKAWVLYVRAIRAVDLTQASPAWPAVPA